MVFQVTRLVESASVSDTIALIAASDVSDAHIASVVQCGAGVCVCKHRCKRFQVANVAVLSWYVRCLPLAELLCLTSPFWDLIALRACGSLRLIVDGLYGRSPVVATHEEHDAKVLNAQVYRLDD